MLASSRPGARRGGLHSVEALCKRPRQDRKQIEKEKPRRQSPARPACSARTTGTFLGKDYSKRDHRDWVVNTAARALQSIRDRRSGIYPHETAGRLQMRRKSIFHHPENLCETHGTPQHNAKIAARNKKR